MQCMGQVVQSVDVVSGQMILIVYAVYGAGGTDSVCRVLVGGTVS